MAETITWRTPPAPIPEERISRVMETEVLVIGAGYAGTAAARAAAEAGAGVIVLEQQLEEKYNAFGQDVGHINSRFLASHGVPKVDPIDLFNDMMLRSCNRSNPELVMQMCQKSGENFDWFTDVLSQDELDKLHIRFWPHREHFTEELHKQRFWTGCAVFPGMINAGEEGFDYDEPSLTTVVLRNQQKAKDLGAEFYFGTTGDQLIKDGSRVIGAIAKTRDGEYYRIMASKGVILAAGDFGGNKEMCRDLVADITDLLGDKGKILSFGRSGRGIQMGVWAGGALEARPLATNGGNNATLKGVTYTFGELVVNEKGKRFSNEVFGDPVLTGFAFAQEKICTKYMIFDSNIIENLQYAPPAHTEFPAENQHEIDILKGFMSKAVAAGPEGTSTKRPNAPGHASKGEGNLYAADTIEELASYLSDDPVFRQNMIDSYHRYNEMCRKGRDDDFGKDPVLLKELCHPPYYAQPVDPTPIGFFLVTVGGLLTDGHQNVLDENKDPIPGLYASGNCCGRRFALQYSTPISGMSISAAFVLGREAGKYAAEG